MIRHIIRPVVILASAITIGILTVSNTTSPIRPWLAFWFLLVCPGLAYIPLLNLEGLAAKVTLILAFSITIDTIVAEALVLTHAWDPLVALLVVIVICLVGTGLSMFRFLRGNFQRQVQE